jgi:biopolymer transport protein ExbB
VVMVAIIAERIIVFSQIMQKPLISYDNPDKVVQKLRRRLVPLYTVLVISPMLGLIGTVIGLMRSFHLLGSQEAITDPVIISRGISEALITTATGLIIAVISTIFYNYFNSRLENYVQDYNSSLTTVSKQSNV